MSPEVEHIFILLILFQLKQFVADFPLQREYMLKKTLPGWEFLAPLSIHCAVHAILTLAIVLMVNASLWWLSLVDFACHFIMDRIKSGPRYLGRFNDKSKSSFWNIFGFDQMFHHLTHLAIVAVLIYRGSLL
ncbi:MAG: DUF3307 domain-containing protein [Bdellovibrionales bacterium]|nr:DUF3307 domain-containing protein [Bdellovibrionales bacterium]